MTDNIQHRPSRRAFLQQSFLALSTMYFPAVFAQAGEGPAALHLRTYDRETGRLIPSSIAIHTSEGRLLTSTPAYTRGIRSPGELHIAAPAGRTEIVITRGFDYQSERRVLDLVAGQTSKCVVGLARVSSLRRAGWVCGDNHVHMGVSRPNIDVTFAFAGLTACAEALDYMSLAQGWILHNPVAKELSARCAAASAPDCTLHWNMEEPKNYWKGDVSHCMGHCWNLGMSDLGNAGEDPVAELYAMSAADYEKQKVPTPNFESHAFIHSVGGIVVCTHPCRLWRGVWGGKNGFPLEQDKFVSNLSQELPFDTIAGPTYDCIDIMMQTSEHLVNELGEQLWYMLLNHGYRIPATASSDATFETEGRAIPGAVRVYTRIDGELTITKVASEMKAGRNFVTSGPLLDFSINHHQIGDIIPVASPFAATGRVRAWASGILGEYLTKIEVIRNGDPYKTFELTGRPCTHEVVFPLEEAATSWYIVRVHGSQRDQIAISNPIYFETPDYVAPRPATAHVELQITAAGSGSPLDGQYEVLEMIGRHPRILHTGAFSGGRIVLTAPSTARIRIAVPGYTSAMQSIFIDTRDLLRAILDIQLPQLLDWKMYEQIRSILGRVHLCFEMHPTA